MEATDVKDTNLPLVSLVVPVKDSLKFTKLMMETYREATSYPNRELIFVDNGSTSATRRYLKAQDDIDVVVRFSSNVGFPAGVNAGIEEARGEYVGILNNDILLSHGWLTKMVRVLQERPKIGIVSPLRVGKVEGYPGILPFQHKNLEGWPDSSFSREQKLQKLMDGMHEFVAQIEEGFFGQVYTGHTMLPFFCTLIRRAVFDDVGLLDEDFGVGLVEDTYFCRKATDAGWGLASCLDDYVHHFMSQTLSRVVGDEENMAAAAQKNYALMRRKLAEASA